MSQQPASSMPFRMVQDPRAERSAAAVEQILQRLPPPGTSVDVLHLFNEITCNIEYREFRQILDRLVTDGLVRIIQARNLEEEDRLEMISPSAEELFDQVERLRA